MTRFATTIPLLKEGRIDMIDSHMWYSPQPAAQVPDEMYADGSLQKIFSLYGHCLLPAPYKVTTGPIPAPTCGSTAS